MKNKLVYCKMAEITSIVANVITVETLYTGEVVNNELVVLSPEDLNRGDLIHFLPVVPVIGIGKVNGTLSVVDRVLEGGAIVLGNLRITMGDLRRIDELHISGKL